MAPQIRCPNCGTSINLESRRKMDFHLIVSELKKGPKTFTDLLHVTRLPRKTLSLRLKELRQSGIIIKDKDYRLNGSPPPFYMKGEISKLFTFDQKKRILLLTLILCVSLPISALAYAIYSAPPPLQMPPEPPKPQYYGILVVDLKTQNVTNLYAWQARINYDAEILEFRNFTKTEVASPLFNQSLMDIYGMNSTDTFVLRGDPGEDPQHLSDDLLVADSLQGDVSPVNGSGTLGRIVFAIKTPEKSLEFFQNKPPTIVFEPTIVPGFTTYLLDAKLEKMSNIQDLLYLEVINVVP